MTKKEFIMFHRNNPEVYNEIVKLARQIKNRGYDHYGMQAIFEVIRFHTMMKTSGDHFKINNNWRSYYSRLVMANNPDLEGFFRIRESA